MTPVTTPCPRYAGLTTAHQAEVDVVAFAFGAVRTPTLAYVSCPVSSGRRLYQVASDNGVTVARLRASPSALHDEVIVPNIADAIRVSDRTIATYQMPVICPALFDGRPLHWGQEAYMAMWLRVIRTQVTLMVMVDDWAYSDGACEELAEALELQTTRSTLRVVTEAGVPITAHTAITLMHAAAEMIAHITTPTVQLACIDRLRALASRDAARAA